MDIDLLRPDLKLNSHAELGQIRDASPIGFSERHQVWCVFGYEEVRNVLLNHQTFSSETTAMHQRKGTPPTLYQQVHVKWFVQKDPPKHTELRRFFGSYFTPRKIRQIESDITQLVVELIDELDASGDVDFVSHFATRLPSRVICDLLGVPAADAELFKRWTSTLTDVQELDRTPQEIQAADDATVQSQAYFSELIDEKIAHPSDDIISHILKSRDPSLLDDAAISANLFLLLSAGHETTINLLTNLMWMLANSPDQWAKLRRDPDLSSSASEEALRFDSPVFLVGRVAKSDVVIRDQKIGQGDPVIVFIGIANRDPLIFDDPDRFLIERKTNPHLAFGFSVHHCLGAPLARLEARCAYTEIAKRIQSVEVKGSTRLDTLMIRGFTELNVTYQR